MHVCKPDPHPGGESFSKVFECNGNFSSIFVDLEFCSAVVDDYHHRVITDLPFLAVRNIVIRLVQPVHC